MTEDPRRLEIDLKIDLGHSGSVVAAVVGGVTGVVITVLLQATLIPDVALVQPPLFGALGFLLAEAVVGNRFKHKRTEAR